MNFLENMVIGLKIIRYRPKSNNEDGKNTFEKKINLSFEKFDDSDENSQFK